MNLKELEPINWNYRPDIDGLRALAVLYVIGYHLAPGKVQGGFIGVDIFFVISGFVISRIIYKNLYENDFSFVNFYSRRIKRIFPALLLVLSSCVIFGYFSLYTDEYKALIKHMFGGVSFVSNFILFNESGYFDTASEGKPLLHLWSLGIEEQFYLICPLFIWLFWKHKKLFIISLTTLILASFLCNLVEVNFDMLKAFYFPQNRFWELFSGVALGYLNTYNKNFKISPYKKPPNNLIASTGMLLIILGLIFTNNEKLFPGAWVCLPVIGTILIICAGESSWINKRLLGNKLMINIGLISYPLYLWHWPIISYLYIIYNGNIPKELKILALILSLALAAITYYFIEKPIRYTQKNSTRALLIITMTLTITWLFIYKGEDQRFKIMPNDSYVQKQSSWTTKEYVTPGYEKSNVFTNASPIKNRDFYNSNQANPEIAIIGDCLANRSYLSLKKFDDLKIINIGRGSCPPLLDTEVFDRNNKNLKCQPLTNNYLNLVKNDPLVKVIILNAYFNKYREARLKIKNNITTIEQALQNTINYLQDSHKKIIVMLNIPEVPSSCYERPFPIWKKSSPVCTISKLKYNETNQSLLKVLSKNPKVGFYNPGDIFCKENCGEIDSKNYLYLRDGYHLNDYGVAKMGQPLYEYVQLNVGVG